MVDTLHLQVASYRVQWDRVLERIQSHPEEVSYRDYEEQSRNRVIDVALSRRIQDYPPFRVVKALVETYPAAVWTSSRPLIAACWRRASRPIIHLLLTTRPFCLPRDEEALVGLWESHVQIFEESSEQSFLDFICTSGREGAMIWTKLHMLLQHCTQRQGTIEWKPLHVAASMSTCETDFLQFLVDLYPQQLHQCDTLGRLPLHAAASLETSQSTSEKPEKQEHETDLNTARIRLLLESFQEAAQAREATNGRLPLHCAIASNQPWECLESIIHAYPDALSCHDFKPRLYPFQLAAATTSTPLDVIYRLLRCSPHLVLQQDEPQNAQNHDMLDPVITEPFENENENNTTFLSLQGLMERVCSSADASITRQFQHFLSHWRDMHAPTSWFAVHAAASMSCCPLGLLQLAIRMNPKQTRYLNQDGRLPLHLVAAMADMDWYTLDKENDQDLVVARLSLLLQEFPEGARVRDAQEQQLALHLAITANQSWQCLETIIQAWPNALCHRDGYNFLYPFQLAAIMASSNIEEVSSIDITYRLLRSTPHLVATGIEYK